MKATLNKVIKEKSDLSELANILLEKCEGRYYSKDKELAHLRDEEKFLYKQSRDKYLTTDFKMNIQQTNIIDRALSKFKKPLAELAGRDAKLYIMKDTCTRAAAEGIGVRHIKKGDPIHSGFFYDSATGMSMPPKLIFVSKKDLKTKDKFNTFAHEFNHAFYRTCLTEGEDKEKLLLLYKNAVEQGRCLDKYAEYTDGEYFAQGHEAYCSVYKPHNAIFDNNDFNDTTCHLRSTLKRKDPELYDFIEHCIKKYGG